MKPTTYTKAEAEATRIAIEEKRDVPIYRIYKSGKYTLDKPDAEHTVHNTIAGSASEVKTVEANYQDTYWCAKGKHEEFEAALNDLIPAIGTVKNTDDNPALEIYRIAVNCYYDLYNNGLGNRGKEFHDTFGFDAFGVGESRYGRDDDGDQYDGSVELTQALIDRTETKMDAIILAAYAEQFPHLNKLREIGVIATSSEDGPPTRCPYCGGTDITELDQWAAVSEDGESNETLVEWQCINACGGRAFWI